MDYLTNTVESKLTVFCLGVSEDAIEGTDTCSDASLILSLNFTLQIAVGTRAVKTHGTQYVTRFANRRGPRTEM